MDPILTKCFSFQVIIISNFTELGVFLSKLLKVLLDRADIQNRKVYFDKFLRQIKKMLVPMTVLVSVTRVAIIHLHFSRSPVPEVFLVF
jgi:hypothetical protein